MFGAALGSEGLGALISDTARFARNLDGHSCLSLTDIFDTIGTLIGTGEKVGIVATSGENHESAKLTRLYTLI